MNEKWNIIEGYDSTISHEENIQKGVKIPEKNKLVLIYDTDTNKYCVSSIFYDPNAESLVYRDKTGVSFWDSGNRWYEFPTYVVAE